MIGTAIAKGAAMRLMGLDTIRHFGNPPTRGWFTQEDLLARWYEVGCDDVDDEFLGILTLIILCTARVGTGRCL